MSLPLASILLLLVYTLVQYKYRFPALALYIFLVLFILIQFLSPSFDDQYYILAAKNYRTVWDALADTGAAVSPVSPLIGLLLLLGFEPRTAVLLVNACFTAAIMLTTNRLIEKRLQNARTGVFWSFPLLLMLFPSTSVILITGNKDLCIVFCLVSFFDAEITKNPSQKIYLAGVGKALRIVLSLLVLVNLRQYFVYYIALSYCLLVLLQFLRKIRFNCLFALSTSFAVLYLILSAIIFFKWNDIRVLVHTYYGAASIWPLYSIDAPSPLTAFVYPIYSLFSILFYPFSLAVTNTDMELPKLIIGFYEAATLLLLSLLAAAKLSKTRDLAFAPLLFFILIHFTIQPFGSPNVGSLIRLRLFEVFLLTSFKVSNLIPIQQGLKALALGLKFDPPVAGLMSKKVISQRAEKVG